MPVLFVGDDPDDDPHGWLLYVRRAFSNMPRQRVEITVHLSVPGRRIGLEQRPFGCRLAKLKLLARRFAVTFTRTRSESSAAAGVSSSAIHCALASPKMLGGDWRKQHFEIARP